MTCTSMVLFAARQHQCNYNNILLFSLSLWLYSPFALGRFFSSLIPHTVGRTPWTGFSPSQGRYLHTEQHKHRINKNIHALSGIRTTTRVRAGEDGSCLRPRGHCDRHNNILMLRQLPERWVGRGCTEYS
jgi:hypothetical protein